MASACSANLATATGLIIFISFTNVSYSILESRISTYRLALGSSSDASLQFFIKSVCDIFLPSQKAANERNNINYDINGYDNDDMSIIPSCFSNRS